MMAKTECPRYLFRFEGRGIPCNTVLQKSPGMMALFALLLLILAAAVVLSLTFLTGAMRIVVAVVDAVLALLLIWVLSATIIRLKRTRLS